MIIQGEQLRSLNVEQVMRGIFNDSMHAKRQRSLANAILGVITVFPLSLELIKKQDGSTKNDCENNAEKPPISAMLLQLTARYSTIYHRIPA